MEGSYHQLIAKLRPVSSIDEGIEKLDKVISAVHPNHSRNFFTHPFVVDALDLNSNQKLEDTAKYRASPKKEVGVNWWEMDKSADKSVIPKSSVSVPKDVDICGDPNCSEGVSAFDFRCFTCRKRFCDVHKNIGIDCKSCGT
jgi:hypothetical protein|tara:strand:+ start:57 stop:482 length:426 start_codon:yes stop_codon:yes gene_type:complete